MTMTPQEFQAVYPQFMGWVEGVLNAHASRAQPVAAKGFVRLPLYFSRQRLASAKYVVVDRVPMPPLTALGLRQFAEFEHADNSGVTYLDTYFVKRNRADDEALHFHELIHVIQWSLLGPERFLGTYAAGLETFGYRNSPLEAMAFDAEALFAQVTEAFDAELFVAEKLHRI
jgi:hypothetical protein